MMDNEQILNIISQELSQSLGSNSYDSSSTYLESALGTYLGQPNGKEVEGRSAVTSTDVADAIEWIMPEIVKAFTQNNEVVTFDAVNQGDELQAELESKYVYDILMKDNNGFIVIHQLVKDALMQKNGYVKVFYEESVTETTEKYTGLTEIEFNVLLSDDTLEVMELTEEIVDNILIFDLKVKRIKDTSGIRVVSVAPENFRVNRQHNSVCLDEARFTANIETVTAGDLIKAGFDREIVDSIPSSAVTDEGHDYRFYMQGESIQPDGFILSDPSLREVDVVECVMLLDIDEDGIPERVKILAGGDDSPVVVLETEEVDDCPYVSATCILMSHKLLGLSIYDRLKEIQEQKTSLWRNIFDNLYLQNNQRTAAVEGQVNLDDLMISRPGGIVRVKRLDSLQPITTPPISGDAYRMMDYLDVVRSGRAGVSPEGPVTDSMIGDRVGSEGVERMMSQKEELVGLMIRVVAEVAIKPICYKIRNLVRKHQNTVKDYKFRGEWVQVDPRTWSDRSNTTVRVGTGSGNRKEQTGSITQILAIQEKMLANPKQTLVKEEQVYNAVNDFAKFTGLPGASRYFLDPASKEGKQHKQQVEKQGQAAQQAEQKEKQVLAEAQSKIANAEASKAQTAQQNVQLKAQIDQGKNELTAQKQQYDVEMSLMKQRLAEAEAALKADENNEELQFKYWDSQKRFELGMAQINANSGDNSDE